MAFYAYVLTGGRSGKLYTGHTDDPWVWKLERIERSNPGWGNLFEDML